MVRRWVTWSGAWVTCAAEDLLRRGADEGRPPGEELVCHHAEGIDVGALVDLPLGHRLFGGHVRRGAERDPDAGDAARAGRLAHRLRDPEVHDQGVTAGEHHVVGLDVAVHHPLAVCVGERVRHLGKDPHHLIDREFAPLGQSVPEGDPLHVRHHVVEEPVGLTGVEEGEDVRVLQPRGHLDLAEEAFAAERGGEVGTEDLHRHPAAMLDILGQVDGGHPPGAELTKDPVFGSEGGGQAFAHRVLDTPFRCSIAGQFWR